MDELLAGDAVFQRRRLAEERVGRGEGLRVGFKLRGKEAVDLAGFGWELVEFEKTVCGIERDFALNAFVELWLVEDAVKPHFKVFRGSEGVDEGGLLFFVGELAVWIVARVVELIEGRVFPVGLFLGVSVGGVFFQGGFLRAVVVALGLAGVQFARIIVGGWRTGVQQIGGVLQSPIFFAFQRVEKSFSLLGGEFSA